MRHLEVQRVAAGVVGLSRQAQTLGGALSTFSGARQDTNRSRRLSCWVSRQRLNFDIVPATRRHFCEKGTHAPDGCWPFSTRIDQKKPRPTEGRRPGLLRQPPCRETALARKRRAGQQARVPDQGCRQRSAQKRSASDSSDRRIQNRALRGQNQPATISADRVTTKSRNRHGKCYHVETSSHG